MSEENKDLEDKAEDSFDNAKESDKDFAEEAKETVNDFSDDVKEAFDPSNPDSGKTVAIIAHITVIGWIVALIMNNQNKTEIGSFYIRQTLGIWLLIIVLNFIPIVGCFAALAGLVLIIISLVAAINGKKTLTIGIGQLFQDWFKSFLISKS